MDLSKRRFMQLGSIPLVAALSSGTVTAQTDSSGITTDGPGFQEVAILYGPRANRPDPNDGYFDNRIYYAYLYISSEGGRYYRTQNNPEWTQLPFQLPRYTEANLPDVLEEGQLVYNESRGVIALSDGEDWEYPVVGDDVLLNSQTVQNTTTETLVWDGGLNAGSIRVGRVYEINLLGTFTNSSTSDTVDINAYLGGALIASVGSTGGNATDAPWRTKIIFTVRETGETGTIEPHAVAKFNNQDADDDEGQVTVDTTIPEEIEVYVQWNNAKADNWLTLKQAYMKEVS